jgi:peptidoglycan/LPS O-acetylase OafA/YrhL
LPTLVGDPVIEALRGFAAIMVMVTHYTYFLTPEAGIWGFASTGVDLFFVLSGYVFAPYFFGKQLTLGTHLIRRFFRLYPLYFCALLLYVALHVPATSAWNHFWSHLFMGHTITSLAVASFYNPAFWSLPPEVEYYLLLSSLASASMWLRFGQRRIFGVAAVTVVAAVVHIALVAAASPNDTGVTVRAIATVHLPGLLVEFMLGTMAFAMAQSDFSRRFATLRLVLGLVTLVGTAFIFSRFVAPVAGLTRTVPPWIGGNIGLGAALGYALVVSGISSAGQAIPQRATNGHTSTLRWWPRGQWQHICVMMGELSYGVYLFHNAAPQVLGRIMPNAGGAAAALLCTGMTLLMAFTAHHVIENPLRAFGRRLSHKVARSK